MKIIGIMDREAADADGVNGWISEMIVPAQAPIWFGEIYRGQNRLVIRCANQQEVNKWFVDYDTVRLTGEFGIGNVGNPFMIGDFVVTATYLNNQGAANGGLGITYAITAISTWNLWGVGNAMTAAAA